MDSQATQDLTEPEDDPHLKKKKNKRRR